MARPAVGFRLFPPEAMAPLKEDLGLHSRLCWIGMGA